MPHEVIMPALGMAQDSGIIVAWHKAVGDPVATGDLLMEVETDKAVMEVEAQADGFLTERRAEQGVDVPVGEVIAIIGASADDVVARSAPRAAPAPTREAVGVPPASGLSATSSVSPAPTIPTAPPNSGGRILASPKAKRLARERGLDLNRLAAFGHPQPFHVADLEVLAAMHGTGRVATRISARARVPASAFDALLAWLEPETGQISAPVIAAFAAGAFRTTTGAERVAILVSAPRVPSVTYVDPDRSGLKALAPMENAPVPDLIVHDLTATRLAEFDPGTERCPVLSVARDGEHILASLAAAPTAFDDQQIIACLEGIAGRLDEPLRHLL